MVSTNNKLLSKIIVSMRDWGRDCTCDSGTDNKCGQRFTQQHGKLPLGFDHKYCYSHLGYNLKATDMQAAIGVAQLDKFVGFNISRRNNWNYLYNELKDIPEITIAKNYNESNRPCYFGFMFHCKDNSTRNRLAQYLENSKIQTRNLFAGNITLHPCFESLVENVDYKIYGTLDTTNRIMNNALCIGVYPGLTKAYLTYMVRNIQVFFNE
jgi:CDP-6-deoxy-D-xylo-4-hexulose-3-dehydrase